MFIAAPIPGRGGGGGGGRGIPKGVAHAGGLYSIATPRLGAETDDRGGTNGGGGVNTGGRLNAGGGENI